MIRQAGEELSCDCGRKITVPRLRELAKLPVAPSPGGGAPPSRKRKWSRIQGILFAIGVPLTVLALGFAANYLRLHRLFKIERPALAEFKYAVNMLEISPTEAWTIWKDISGDRLPTRPQNDYIARRDAARLMTQRANIALGFAVAGGLMTLTSFLIPSPKERR